MDNVTNETTPKIEPSSTGIGRPRKRGKWQVIALGLAILLCGMLIGAGGTLICVKRIVLHAIHHPEEAPARIAARMQKKLHLTEKQAVRVRAVLAERHRAIMAIRRDAQPKVIQELEKAKRQVAAILTPDQARSWNRRFDELQHRWIPVLPAEPQ